MRYIYAPWRAEYVKNVFKKKECIFCKSPQAKTARQVHILFRGTYNFIMLNLYPYNPGHLMIAPYKHLDSMEKASKESTDEMTDLIKTALQVLRSHYNPQGFNTGMNIGRSAGAGMDTHFHFHIVPRWVGDSNFMPIIGKTKVIIEDLDMTFDQLEPLFKTALRLPG